MRRVARTPITGDNNRRRPAAKHCATSVAHTRVYVNGKCAVGAGAVPAIVRIHPFGPRRATHNALSVEVITFHVQTEEKKFILEAAAPHNISFLSADSARHLQFVIMEC